MCDSVMHLNTLHADYIMYTGIYISDVFCVLM